jgi:hypothetical protein
MMAWGQRVQTAQQLRPEFQVMEGAVFDTVPELFPLRLKGHFSQDVHLIHLLILQVVLNNAFELVPVNYKLVIKT